MHVTSCSVFSDVSQIDSVREEGSVIVYVLEVHLDVGVTDQSVAAFVLGKNGEPPLRSAVGLVSIQWLMTTIFILISSIFRVRLENRSTRIEYRQTTDY